jgi:hypothetical protein
VTFRVAKIVSGGQTGVDRAALDVAIALQIPCGGWCPRGRRAEDGRLHERYPLQETESRSYSRRTIQNVIDSDGTLIITIGTLTGGTLLTKNTAEKHQKPYVIVDLADSTKIASVRKWMQEHAVGVLNVAGPRASKAPDAYRLATSLLVKLLKAPALTARKRRRARPKA